MEAARRGHDFIWSQKRLKLLRTVFYSHGCCHLRLNVSTLDTVKVLLLSLHAENYLHTDCTLFEISSSALTGSGVWEGEAFRACLVELGKTYE